MEIRSRCRLYAHALRCAFVPDSSRPASPAPAAFGSFLRRVARWLFAAIGIVVLAAAALLWLANRAFTPERPVVRGSRLTSGNMLFPVQVAVFPDRLARYKPKLLGHIEDSITLRQIASVKVQSGPVFADVVIDTTGGSPPVVIHGLWKKDAVSLSSAIAAAQAASPMPVKPVPATASAPPPG